MSVLLTGATGFVGMSVLARLLERGDEVVAIVRGADPQARLDEALDRAGVPAARRRAARAVAGELTAPGLGLGLGVVPPSVDTVVHCAASVAFDHPVDRARAINVGGTRAVLDVAERAGARLVHVSTAYVAGRHRGHFAEDAAAAAPVRNTYEQTKREADALVLAAAGRVDTVVLRPSIVVGEASTGWTSAFNVLYWPLRAFSRGLIDAVPALPAGRVDVVPVDFVADAIVHVAAERPDVGGALHLVAGEGAVTVAELVALACSVLGRPQPRLVEPERVVSLGGSEQGAAYVPYFDMEVVFGDRRARSVLAPAGIAAPVLAEYFGRLMDFAERARWGKAPLARAA